MTLSAVTFDVTILENRRRLFEVKSPTANHLPWRPKEFDIAIVNYLADEFRKEKPVDLDQGQDGAAASGKKLA